MLSGAITLMLGDEAYKIKKGGSFCFKPTSVHYILNLGKKEASVLWVSTPPSF